MMVNVVVMKLDIVDDEDILWNIIELHLLASLFYMFKQLLILTQPSCAQRACTRPMISSLCFFSSIVMIIIIGAGLLPENMRQDQVGFTFIEEINDDLSKLPVINETEIKVQYLYIVAI